MIKKLFYSFMTMAVAASCCAPVFTTGVPEKVKPTKNLIVLLTDGTSIGLLSTARWFDRYMQDSLDIQLYTDDYLCGFVQSRLSDALIPDSAPAMSGYMTGIPCSAANLSIYPVSKPNQDVVKTDSSRSYQPSFTLLEAAKLQGKSTGLVATVFFSHATPAACASHTASRYRYADITMQMANHDIDVLISADDSQFSDEAKDIVRGYGTELISRDVEAMRNFHGDKLWSLYGHGGLMEFEIDRNDAEEPSLAEMTDKAIEVLSKNKKGFFLMVEGSKVDYAAHSNDPIGVVGDFLAFDKAVKVAVDFAKKDKNTTVVILPDHGCSGITLGDRHYRDYYKKGIDSMFVNMKNFKASSGKLSHIVAHCPKDSIAETFKHWTGINLRPQELEKFVTYRNAVEGNYMEVANSINLQAIICQVLASRTHIGFTSGNHTGEDVFLAVYNPRGERPTGMITNTELNDYMCMTMGLKEHITSYGDKYYAKDEDVFEGCEVSLDKEADPVTLTVTKGDKSVKLFASRAYVEVNGDRLATTFPAVYQPENGHFYCDTALTSHLN